jgi:hypothetical protein
LKKCLAEAAPLCFSDKDIAMMQAHSSSSNASSGKDAAGREFLAFTLGSEEYGIDILKVQEIRGYEAVTRIANAPEFIKGVINLRGIIIPVVDMRIKFNLGTPVYDQFTVSRPCRPTRSSRRRKWAPPSIPTT